MTATYAAPKSEQLEMNLSEAEQTELNQCEDIIARGKETFVEVGEALLVIRDQRLYRATHRTFAAYCEEKHDFSKTMANNWIQAAVLTGEMQASGVTVANESQARNLGRLPEDVRQEAVQEARNRAEEPDKPVSARDVLNIAQNIQRDADAILHPHTPAAPAEPEPVEVPDWFPESLSGHTNERLSTMQDNIADIKFNLTQKAQQPGANAQVYQGQIDGLELALSRIDAEWQRRNALPPSIAPAAETPATDTGDDDAEKADVEMPLDNAPQAEAPADDTDTAGTAPVSAGTLSAPVEPVPPAPVTPVAQEIVTTLDRAAHTPPIKSREQKEIEADDAARSHLTPAVVDKREERAADLDKAAPVPTPAPSAGGWVSAMIPRDEKDWLDSQGLMPGAAIALLRELRLHPPMQTATPIAYAPGYHASINAFVLGLEARNALQLITERANTSGTFRTFHEQLEAILITRAKLIEDEEFDAAGGSTR